MKAVALLALVLFSAAPAFAQFDNLPSINDPDFVVERFASGISRPTSIAFVGDDMLVLQKDDGQVRVIRGGAVGEAVLDASVANVAEQGMLGIAAVNSTVYLYFSEAETDGGEATGRRVYKYDWTGSALENPVLVRDIKYTQTYHNGGGMAVGPDGTVYLAVGDAGRYGQLQNHEQGFYEDTSVIITVAPEGPYYAMGVRNSFGITFDPFTGRMWDTENGDDSFDEINLVEPYMNSGWDRIMGPSNQTSIVRLPGYLNYTYSEPEFSWERPVAPTGLSFAKSEPLAKFSDSLFVGDCNTGTLYRFTLNESRDGFVFASAELSDGVAGRTEATDEMVFGRDFGCITDIEVGPDGLLYVASLGKGAIFRIVPEAAASQPALQGAANVLVYALAAAVAAGIAAYFIRRRRQ